MKAIMKMNDVLKVMFHDGMEAVFHTRINRCFPCTPGGIFPGLAVVVIRLQLHNRRA